MWIEEWKDYHFPVIRKCLSSVIYLFQTAKINEASSDVIICSKDHQYVKIIDKLS